jgi:hypothetical protein
LALPGYFFLKDVVLLGVATSSAGEVLHATWSRPARISSGVHAVAVLIGEIATERDESACVKRSQTSPEKRSISGALRNDFSHRSSCRTQVRENGRVSDTPRLCRKTDEFKCLP